MLHEPSEIVTLTRAQAREVDRWAIQTLGIPGIVLMENASAAIEEVALAMLAEAGAGSGGVGGRLPRGERGEDAAAFRGAAVLVLCGPGNNGGDGLAVARRLLTRGVGVRVVLTHPRERCGGDAATNLRIAERIGVRIDDWPAQRGGPAATLVIDALLGTGLDRAPSGAIAEAVEWANALRREGAKVLAVDVPTGLDADTGTPLGDAVISADRTVTLACMKAGLADDRAAAYAGAVHVGDIGTPAPTPMGRVG